MSISTFFHNLIAAGRLEISEEEAKIVAEFQKAELAAHQEILAVAANLTQRLSNIEEELKNFRTVGA